MTSDYETLKKVWISIANDKQQTFMAAISQHEPIGTPFTRLFRIFEKGC